MKVEENSCRYSSVPLSHAVKLTTMLDNRQLYSKLHSRNFGMVTLSSAAINANTMVTYSQIDSEVTHGMASHTTPIIGTFRHTVAELGAAKESEGRDTQRPPGQYGTNVALLSRGANTQ